MQYKTIVLEILEQRRQLREELRRSRMLLPTLERYSNELKSDHEAWKERLAQSKPESDPAQIASEAMELALKDLEERLPADSRLAESEPLSIDEAMVFVQRPTSRG